MPHISRTNAFHVCPMVSLSLLRLPLAIYQEAGDFQAFGNASHNFSGWGDHVISNRTSSNVLSLSLSLSLCLSLSLSRPLMRLQVHTSIHILRRRHIHIHVNVGVCRASFGHSELQFCVWAMYFSLSYPRIYNPGVSGPHLASGTTSPTTSWRWPMTTDRRTLTQRQLIGRSVYIYIYIYVFIRIHIYTIYTYMYMYTDIHMYRYRFKYGYRLRHRAFVPAT